MKRQYWIGRMPAAMTMARDAPTAESRLVHDEPAGRYGIRAANMVPFLMPFKGPATPGERETLKLPVPRDRGLGPAGLIGPPAPRDVG